jgi:ribonuclease HI
MGSENAEKLMARAADLVARLQADGIQAQVAQDSLREYSIKVALPAGYAVIHYSPRRQSFNCGRENLEHGEIWESVLACWDGAQPLPGSSGDVDPSAPGDVDLYVDGSYVKETTAYGVVAIQRDQVLWEDSGIVDASEVRGSRQVPGELQAVLKGLEWCAANDISAITIHYDYEGIEKWATGEWRAKKSVTQQYRDTVHQHDLQVTWKKVDAHTGVKWNEHVDLLAKAAALANGPQQAASRDPMELLDDVVGRFREFLQKHGVLLVEKRRSSEPTPHLQLIVTSGEDAWGHLNFYATQERDPYPKFHEVRPAEKRELLEQLWGRFDIPPTNDLDEVDYYYSILAPYGSLNLDFRILAEAVVRIWNQRMPEPLEVESIRYDFAELKKCRDRLAALSEGAKL